MSCRPRAVTLLAVLILAAAGLATPLLAPTTAAAPPYGSHVFEANPYVEPGAQSYSIYSGSIVAQSFLVNETYYLQNVTLRVLNLGNNRNALNVSIHPDDPSTHLPVLGTVLAWWLEITPNNSSVPTNWSWRFNPPVLLQAGRAYWIVAENEASQPSNGYEWFAAIGDTYPDGSALLGSPSWAGLPDDMFFINFGQEYDANVTTAMTVDRTQAQPGAFVTFTVHLNNSGAQAAPWVWVNDTLPSALGNVSLGFPGIQPVSSAAFPDLVFANVANGPHSFTITAQVAVGTSPGTLATNVVSVAYENSTRGVVEAGTVVASIRVGLVTKQLYLGGTSAPTKLLTTVRPTSSTAQSSAIGAGAPPVSFVLAPALAKPLDALNVTAALWIGTQKAPPQTYHVTLDLLDDATTVASVSPTFQITASGPHLYSFALSVSEHTFGQGHALGLRVTNLGGGGGSTDTLVMSYNSTSDNSRLDVVTDTYIQIAPLILENQNGPTAIWSSLDPLIVQANVSDPFGRSRIKSVWINITTPSLQLAASGPMSLVLADSSSLPSWELLNYSLSPPLASGRYRIDVLAMEDNGVTTLAEAWANVEVPAFTLDGIPSAERVGTGDTVALYLWYNNTGTGTAGWAWINDTFPAGLAFVTSSENVTSVSGSTYTWTFTNVSVGAHVLEIDVLVTATASSWVQDEATLEYKDVSGHSGAPLASSVSLFLNGPIIDLLLDSTPTGTIHSNERTSYTIILDNNGSAAGSIWVNATLPADFTFTSTDAEILGGTAVVSGWNVAVEFAGLGANTTLQFHIVATAGPSLTRNATYTLPVTLTYASSNGVLMPSEAANVTLIAVAPWFPWAGINFLVTDALAGATVPAEVVLTNLGSEASPAVWVNLTLDSKLSVADASVPFTAGTGTVAFNRLSVGLGPHLIFLNLTVSAAAQDRAALAAHGTLDARDGYGNALPTQVLVPGTVFVHAAEMTFTVAPTAPVFEAGTPYALTVSCYNWGSDTASHVWLNLTIPSSLSYVNDTSPTPPAVSGSAYSWHRADVSPGSFSFVLYLLPRATLANGTTVSLPFSLEAQGSNFKSLPAQARSVNGTIVAPEIVLSVVASTDRVVPNGRIVYSLRMTNVGMSTAASVYLVDSLDSRLKGLYYDAAIGAAQDNQTYNWTFANLAPGESQVVNLTVQVVGGAASGNPVPNVFEATYTNSNGVVLGRVRSETVTVSIASDLTLPALVGLGAAAAGIGTLLYLRGRKVDIEEVFLVYRDGVLISHLSRTLLREKDEDVLSGMLTAVQEFVREAFQYGEHRDLHQLDFGDYRILIERGKYVFLAIVYSGKESTAIHKKVRAVIDRIESEFGAALENWDGDMEEVVGARDLIRDTLLGSSNHNHAAKIAPEGH